MQLPALVSWYLEQQDPRFLRRSCAFKAKMRVLVTRGVVRAALALLGEFPREKPRHSPWVPHLLV